ncbi:PAS domain S-box protein [Schleiferia thermophila]
MTSFLLDNIQSALICTLDIHANILYSNAAFKKFFLIDETYRGNFFEVIDDTQFHLLKEILKSVTENKKHIKDFVLRLKDKERHSGQKVTWEFFLEDTKNQIFCIGIVSQYGEYILYADNIFNLETILTTTNESSIILSKNVKVEFFSKQAYEDVKKFFGKEIKKGDDFDQYIIPDLRELFYDKFNEALSGNEIYYEINVPVGPSEGTWFFIKFSPIRSAVGGITSVLYSARNIDDIKKYEHELSQQRFYLKSMYDSVDTAIGVFDKNFKVLYTNKSVSDLIQKKFGKKPRKGDSGYEFFYSNNLNFFHSKIERALKGTSEIFEYEDGNEVWRFKIFPIYNENLTIVGTSVHISDITKLKEYEQKIVQQIKFLKQLAWSQSHELRGPLSSILAICENLNLIEDEYLKQNALTSIKKYSDQMDEIIKNTVANINRLSGDK